MGAVFVVRATASSQSSLLIGDGQLTKLFGLWTDHQVLLLFGFHLPLIGNQLATVEKETWILVTMLL